MSKLRLHLDADISIKALQAALVARGHDVSRTPNARIADDASDEMQLLAAARQGRCIVTCNVRDFLRLASLISDHAGIILVTRPDWSFSALVVALDRLLSTVEAEELVGQVRWLSEWRGGRRGKDVRVRRKRIGEPPGDTCTAPHRVWCSAVQV